MKTMLIVLCLALSTAAFAESTCGSETIAWGVNSECGAQVYANGGAPLGSKQTITDVVGRGDAQIVCTESGWKIEEHSCFVEPVTATGPR